MATVRNDQIEVMADIIEVLETENTSLADDLAEAEIKIQSLEAHIRQLMSDRSMAV
jgi:hypothetical protein